MMSSPSGSGHRPVAGAVDADDPEGAAATYATRRAGRVRPRVDDRAGSRDLARGSPAVAEVDDKSRPP